jgi:hypothetical protein
MFLSSDFRRILMPAFIAGTASYVVVEHLKDQTTAVNPPGA